MKFKLNIILLTISSACVIAGSSCKKVLDRMAEYNTNENQPLKASSPTLLTAAEFSGVMLEQGSFVADGDGDGFLGIFNQHFAGNHAEGVNYNIYSLKATDFSFLFNDAYSTSLLNLKQLILNAKGDETAYVGIAEILQAYQLGYLTTVYGDIPWSEALDIEGHPTPKYDAQADIYTAVQNLLTDGIQKVNGGGDVTGDFIYNGDLGKWAACGYLLKARFYNHMSKKDPTGSATNALLMVDSAKLAGFNDNGTAGDFTLPYDGLTGQTTNPWIGMYANGMLVANVVFLDSMLSQNDPRLNAYFTSINGVGGGNVFGLGKVIDGNVGTGKYMEIGSDDWNYFGNTTSPVELATYAELLMIEAEAAFRSGDLARAAAAHNLGVTTQINQMLSLPASKAADKAKVAAYVAKYASETAGTITLEKIMTEKHKLMFTMEAESWMDVRRMNYAYPSWLSIPVVDATASPTVPVASSYIQRLLYPQSELDRNSKNVPSATIFDKLPVLQ